MGVAKIKLLRVVGFIVFCAQFLTAPAFAQYNATYDSSGTITPSASFIDASVATFNTSSDFCTRLYNALSYAQTLTVPPVGVVIDARGMAAFPNTCATSSTPWSQPSKVAITIPSTILLPNGSINISTSWVIPPQTRIVGKGKTQTTIAAGVGLTGSFLQMCSSTCTGVSISDLLISGAGTSLNGIVNQFAQELSFVQHVTINEVEGTGLDIESGATNSGPYEDLNITEGGTSFCNPSSCTTIKATTLCILINGASTRGIHGLTCTANGKPNAGISLNGNGNTIKDAHFEGVVDGIRIGEKASAAGNYIANIDGATGGMAGTSGAQPYVLHICGSNPATTNVCSASFSVTDLTLSQIKTDDTGHTSLLDDISGVELGGTNSNNSIASYVRGQPLSASSVTYGYTQLTTGTATGTGPTLPVPTPDWAQASLGTSVTPSNPCPTGAIFSNITGTTISSGHVLWSCVSGSWSFVK